MRRWPYFSTPLRTFLAVILPVAALMLGMALLEAVPRSIRWTAGGVVVLSAYAFWRGYLHWLEADARELRFRTLLRTISIPWSDVAQIDRYTPPDRNRHTQYVYVTRGLTPPAGRFVCDEQTIQLQDRPGLVEALRKYWTAGGPTGDPHETFESARTVAPPDTPGRALP